jgi:predicted AlkP superfamily phosphohydrolase/phosphomutase
MRRSAWLVVLAFVLALAGSAFSQGQKLVIVSWDGAADWVVDKLLSEGRMPTLQRMKEKGVWAESVLAANPSKTAPGHASIWTGTWPDHHGIAGNEVPILPRAEHTLLEKRSGFHSLALDAEPIWVSATLSGKSATVLSATQAFPPDKWLEELKEAGKPVEQLTVFSGFETQISGPEAYTDTKMLKDAERFGRKGKELEITAAEGKFIAFFGQGEDGVYRDCTLLSVVADRVSYAGFMRLGGTEFTQPIELRKGQDWGLTSFALLDLAPDLSHFFLYQGECKAIKGAFNKGKGDAYVRAMGGFHDLPIFGFYEKGKLGPTWWQKGDGTAEARLLKIVQRDYQRLTEGFRWAVKAWDSTLYIHYSPCLDSLGHLLMGALDPASPRHDKQLADKLWPLYTQAYEAADKWLGSIIEAAGPGAIVAVVSDHGMEGVGKYVSPNRILANAGILSLEGGRIDLAKSKAVAIGGYYVSINTTDWKGGIVEAKDKEAVVRAAAEALLAFKDPDTGKSPIIKATPASEIEGGGGPAGGDLYLDFAPGYAPTDALPAAGISELGPIGAGVHGFDPRRPSMRSIFYAIGPGLSPGRNLGDIRQIDIVPSLCILAGIPTPANATGTNLRLTQKQ